MAGVFRSFLGACCHASNGAAKGPIHGASEPLRPTQFEPPTGAVPKRYGADGEPQLPGEVLDPLCRSLAAPAGPSFLPVATTPGITVAAPALCELSAVEEAVRRVAWGGDRRSGVARIELGGAHRGTAIVVRGAGRKVELNIELARGSGDGGLPARIVERLTARGLDVTHVEVR